VAQHTREWTQVHRSLAGKNCGDQLVIGTHKKLRKKPEKQKTPVAMPSGVFWVRKAVKPSNNVLERSGQQIMNRAITTRRAWKRRDGELQRLKEIEVHDLFQPIIEWTNYAPNCRFNAMVLENIFLRMVLAARSISPITIETWLPL
jgi:hypothetical protein